MKTKRFDFNFRPLQVSTSMSVEGSVPDRQNYDADTGEYTPDYTLTPLTLQPLTGQIDKDGLLLPGNINAKLTNIKYREVEGGASKVISLEDPGYNITTSGDQAGRIQVKKNANPGNPITLEFSADYIDPRTDQIVAIRKTHMVKCNNATPFTPALSLDAPATAIYNPLSDASIQVVRASLKLGVEECPAEDREFVWEVKRSNGSWSEVGWLMDYFLSVSGDTLTVDKSIMGDECSVRCRAKYDINGNPGSVSLSDSSPSASVNFVRRLQKYEYDISGAPVNIPSNLMFINPDVVIQDTNGLIENAIEELLPVWYIATNKSSGSLDYEMAGEGLNPIISTSLMDDINGAVIGVEVKDRGGFKAIKADDTHVYEDADGSILLFR